MTAHEIATASTLQRAAERRPAIDAMSRRILEAAPDAVLVLDAEGCIVFANASAETLFGRSADELAGESPDRWLTASDASPHDVAALVAGGPLCQRSLGLRIAEGRTRRVSVASGRSPFGSNGRSGAVLYLRDLEGSTEAERDLELRNQELEHCVQTLSHDLRSPLVALLGFSRLLRQDYESRLDETGRHFLDRIEQAGRTMEDLIHHMLELSRIERPVTQSLVDPRPVLMQLQAELKPQLDSSGVQLDLPESPPMVCCDRTRLYQLFSNLIGNAIEHMGSCEAPRVRVEIRDLGREHCLCVQDSGQGIAPENHERIFQVFQSLGRRADGRRGTGIGLAIVRRIAETQGGRAWVESSPGAGATFHVTLPIE